LLFLRFGFLNKKTAIAGGFWNLARTVRACYRVNLPLFHRRTAGMAKVKIAGKDRQAAHRNPL